MKSIKKYTSRHKYFTVSARLNHYELLEFRKLQEKHKLSSSKLIKKLIFHPKFNSIINILKEERKIKKQIKGDKMKEHKITIGTISKGFREEIYLLKDDVLKLIKQYKKDMLILKGDTKLTFEEHINNILVKINGENKNERK